MTAAYLLWSVLFGSIGLGFLVYGRRQRMIMPLVAGVALFLFPYFVSNSYALVAIGAVLVSLPYFFRM